MGSPILLRNKTAASFPNSDDNLFLDGATEGTRRLPASAYRLNKVYTWTELQLLSNVDAAALAWVMCSGFPGTTDAVGLYWSGTLSAWLLANTGAASFTVAQLGAMSAAESSIRRMVMVTDAITPLGVVPSPAYYDSVSAKWRLAGMDAEVTADKLTFARSWWATGGDAFSTAFLNSFNVVRTPRNSASSGTGAYSDYMTAANGNTWRDGALDLNAGTAVSGAAISAVRSAVVPRSSENNGFYMRVEFSVQILSTSTDEYNLFVGLAKSNSVVAPPTMLSTTMLGLLYDRGNAYTLAGGNSNNMLAVSRNSSVNTVQALAVQPAVVVSGTDGTLTLFEVYQAAKNGPIQFYLNGTLVHTFNTTSNEALSPTVHLWRTVGSTANAARSNLTRWGLLVWE